MFILAFNYFGGCFLKKIRINLHHTVSFVLVQKTTLCICQISKSFLIDSSLVMMMNERVSQFNFLPQLDLCALLGVFQCLWGCKSGCQRGRSRWDFPCHLDHSWTWVVWVLDARWPIVLCIVQGVCPVVVHQPRKERKTVQKLLFPPLSGRISGRPHLCLELFFPPRTHFLWILRPILCESHSWAFSVSCPSAHEPCPIIARSSVRAPLLSPKYRVT